MKNVSILGAGPAGLYLGYLLKRRRSDLHVRIVEQNAPEATFGFGVVFSDKALQFLSEDDPDIAATIVPQLEVWRDITVVHQGRPTVIDGIAFTSIGRLQLLTLLRERAISSGVELIYNRTIKNLNELEPADVVVAADGINSLVRNTFSEQFGSTISNFNNRFAWFGTTQLFSTLTQTFKKVGEQCFNAHHYRYAPDMSTFVVEVDEPTFYSAGLDQMDEIQSKAACEQIFRHELGGHPLVTNRSLWRQFPRLRNERWWHDKYVLVGDALHTAHFSIGSGTRLAMEDVIALDRALARHPDDLAAAFTAYEANRRPIVEKLIDAADASADWYERFREHMSLEPLDFVWSYITRSGRVDLDRLERSSPQFVAQLRRWRGAAPHPVS